MAKKNVIAEIKKHLAEKKIIIGTKLTYKNLKLGKLQTVYITSNCPQDVVSDLEHYSELSKCSLERLNIPNEELGVICKKPFAISAIGVLK